MKVKELIDTLQSMPPTATVYAWLDEDSEIPHSGILRDIEKAELTQSAYFGDAVILGLEEA
jgi:hypothetical protein